MVRSRLVRDSGRTKQSDEFGPSHAAIACRYCDLKDRRSLVLCADERCQQLFCNGKTADLKASHINAHQELTGHHEAAFYDGRSGRYDIVPICFECGERNIVELGVADISRPFLPRLTLCRTDSVRFGQASSGQWHPFKTCHEQSFRSFASWACHIPNFRIMKSRPNRWIPNLHINRIFLKDLEDWTRRFGNGAVSDFVAWRAKRLASGPLTTIEDETTYVAHFRRLIQILREMEKEKCESFDGLRDLLVQWSLNADSSCMVQVPLGNHSEKIHPGQRVTLSRVDDDYEVWRQSGSIIALTEFEHGHHAFLHMFAPTDSRDRIDGNRYVVELEFNPTVYDRMLSALQKVDDNDPAAMDPQIRSALTDSFRSVLELEAKVITKADPGPGLAYDGNKYVPGEIDGASHGNTKFHPEIATRPSLSFNLGGLEPLLSQRHHNFESFGRFRYAGPEQVQYYRGAIARHLHGLQQQRLAQPHIMVPRPVWGNQLDQKNVAAHHMETVSHFLPDIYSYSKVVQPNGLKPLNEDQRQAVSMALEHPVSLIQGPPGTGKTLTAAAVVYNLAVECFGVRKILCVAPSNKAVDQIADQIGKSGLISVARIYASSRNIPVKSNVNFQVVPNERDAVLCHQVICVTCNCAGMTSLKDIVFPYVVIDECTQAMEPDALIAITKGCKKLVLIGDQEQLGTVVTFRELQGSSLSKSLFERLLLQPLIPRLMLGIQYRMDPAIRKMISEVTYGQSLRDGFRQEASPFMRSISAVFPKPNTPMVFVHIPAIQEFAGFGRSLVNIWEAHFIARLVANLIASGQPGDPECFSKRIGIISFYNGQIAQLRMQLAHHPRIGHLAQGMEVHSVDGFQGREKDIIILSCVRSGEIQKIGGLGFTDDKKRLNVAMSRAKSALFVVGNADLFFQSEIWRKYFDHMPIVKLKEIGEQLPFPCSGGVPCGFCDCPPPSR